MDNRLIATLSQMHKPLIAKKFDMDNPPTEQVFEKAQSIRKKVLQDPRLHQKSRMPSFPRNMFRPSAARRFFCAFFGTICLLFFYVLGKIFYVY